MNGDFWGEVLQESENHGPSLEEELGIEFSDDAASNMTFSLTESGNSWESPLAMIQGKTLMGPENSVMRALTDQGREAQALPLPQEAGNRVAFITNIGSVLTYADIPADGLEGTVITVKTGAGKATSQDERVFVLWDDGKFRAIQAEHLRRAKGNRRIAQNVRMVVAEFMDLTAFFAPTGTADELVHKATKDLWAVKENDGGFVIERLFNDSGKPLKV